MGYGAGWLKQAYKVEMSEFGERVAEFLNVIFQGIYHIEGKGLKEADWKSPNWIEISLSDYLHYFSTYDFDLLTKIVILSHDRCIRVAITPTSPRTVKLGFSPRRRDAEHVSQKMPTLEEHVAQLRPLLTDWEGK